MGLENSDENYLDSKEFSDFLKEGIKKIINGSKNYHRLTILPEGTPLLVKSKNNGKVYISREVLDTGVETDQANEFIAYVMACFRNEIQIDGIQFDPVPDSLSDIEVVLRFTFNTNELDKDSTSNFLQSKKIESLISKYGLDALLDSVPEGTPILVSPSGDYRFSHSGDTYLSPELEEITKCNGTLASNFVYFCKGYVLTTGGYYQFLPKNSSGKPVSHKVELRYNKQQAIQENKDNDFYELNS